jgi:hypothetical protein
VNSRRPIAIIVAVLLVVGAPLATGARQAGKVWRIGFLSLNSDIVQALARCLS